MGAGFYYGNRANMIGHGQSKGGNPNSGNGRSLGEILNCPPNRRDNGNYTDNSYSENENSNSVSGTVLTATGNTAEPLPVRRETVPIRGPNSNPFAKVRGTAITL